MTALISKSLTRHAATSALVCVIGLLALPSDLFSQNPPVAPGAADIDVPRFQGETIEMYPFYNAPLFDMIIPMIYQPATGRQVIPEASLQATQITSLASGPMTRAEAESYLKALFFLNNINIVPHDDKTDKFVSTQKPSSVESLPLYATGQSLPEGEGIINYVMQLEAITPDEAARIFSTLAPFSVRGNIIPVPNANAIIITENIPYVRQLVEMKPWVDKPLPGVMVQSIKLKNADPQEVAQQITDILSQQGSGRQGATAARGIVANANNGLPNPLANANLSLAGPNSPIGTTGLGQVPDAESVQISANLRTNSLLVVAKPSDFAFIERIIAELDADTDVETFLIRDLKHIAVAEFVPLAVSALERIVSDPQAQGSAAGGGQLGGNRNTGNTRTSANTGNNRNTGNNNNLRSGTNPGGGGFGGGLTGGGTLQGEDLGFAESFQVGNTQIVSIPQLQRIAVSGPPEHRQVIDRLIDVVDVRRPQVYVSAIIAQVTIGDNVQFGFDLLRQVEQINIGGSPVNLAGSFSRNGGIPIIDPLDLVGVSDFGALSPGLALSAKFGDFLNAYIQALENTNHFKVISRPFVFADNNEPAIIGSGQRIPVPTQTISSVTNNDTVNSSIGFEEVLLELEIVPLINSADEVTLTINQRNENILGFVELSNNQVPQIGTQSLNSRVRVPNGGIVAVGGIVQEDERRNVNGLPGLARIPVLRFLTGSQTREKNRSELLILVQPIIISNSTDLMDANNDEINRLVVGESALDVGLNRPKEEKLIYDDTNASNERPQKRFLRPDVPADVIPQERKPLLKRLRSLRR